MAVSPQDNPVFGTNVTPF